MTDTTLNIEATQILGKLAEVLPKIRSSKDERGNQLYDHEDISPYVEPLLDPIGLNGWKYTVWKFYTSFKWCDLPGPVVIIPICDISKSACSTPGGPLVYGIMRKINGDALVHPSLAAVFVVPPIKSSP
ncbi:hypothetical protein BDV33DRAFT_184023 [Aspergillus novoparasiticus]|uniref:Uncharacterized protein n=1 Tax=Aspergillus novoparasiticus TaxID=986946 RepID=A0A5N6EAG0_9EURO|nr:hypothetical protein BDV33DRAFT_184023 [Aspergillus novoparasiticus]